MLRGFSNVATAQCQSYGIKLESIVDRQIGRPPGFVLDQFDRNFGGVLALVNEFDGLSSHGIFRFMKSEDQRVGSGQCAHGANRGSN